MVQGISLDIEGLFSLQLSAKSTGLFESFYSSLKPILMIKELKDIAGEGRITDRELNDKHEKKFPFHFTLKVLKAPFYSGMCCLSLPFTALPFAAFHCHLLPTVSHFDALFGSMIPQL